LFAQLNIGIITKELFNYEICIIYLLSNIPLSFLLIYYSSFIPLFLTYFFFNHIQKVQYLSFSKDVYHDPRLIYINELMIHSNLSIQSIWTISNDRHALVLLGEKNVSFEN